MMTQNSDALRREKAESHLQRSLKLNCRLSPSLRAQRSNPSLLLLRRGLLRFARNDVERVVGWAKRSVPTITQAWRKMAGTARWRLCPPYKDQSNRLDTDSS